MRVTLVHAEIQSAVVAMLAKRGVNIEGQDIAVAFSMGRKNTGLSATVDIVDPSIIQLPDAVVDEDEDQMPPAGAAPKAEDKEAKETKDVKNTFVAKADDAGTVTVVNDEAKEKSKLVEKAEEDPPFELDKATDSTASADASAASEATSATAEEAPKKTTQSLFAQ